MFAAGLLFSLLLPAVLGGPLTSHSDLVVRSQRSAVPSGFLRSDVAPHDMLRLTIAMTQSDMAGLQAALLDASNPLSPNYGQHLSKAQVEQFVAPRPETVKAVMDWLDSKGIEPAIQSSSGDVLTLHLPVAHANDLLAANYTPFVHEDTNTAVMRTLSYSLPSHLHEHIAFVYPTTHFDPPAVHASVLEVVQPPTRLKRSPPMVSIRKVPSSCNNTFSYGCLQALYNIPATPANASGNNIVIGGFNGNGASRDDLNTSVVLHQPNGFINATFNFQTLHDGQPVLGATEQGSLDVQYSAGLATNVSTTYLSDSNSTSGTSTIGDFLDMALFLVRNETAPLVLTTSSSFVEDLSDPQLMSSLCSLYMQLGARGTTVLFPVGDHGIAGNSENCTAGSNFQPTFPASCPYVTAVGSTQGFPETAAPFSAGGFSNHFPRPDYQTAAVQAYLAEIEDANAGLFNSSGRAYPDVSMAGSNFLVKVNGTDVRMNGTGASTAAFAGFVALLNEQLLQAGKSPLGFLNPLLYGVVAGTFNNITSGSNPGCGTDGFPARAGWDPVTGLGTPDFIKMLYAVSNHTIKISPSAPNDASSRAIPGLVQYLPFLFLALFVL